MKQNNKITQSARWFNFLMAHGAWYTYKQPRRPLAKAFDVMMERAWTMLRSNAMARQTVPISQTRIGVHNRRHLLKVCPSCRAQFFFLIWRWILLTWISHSLCRPAWLYPRFGQFFFFYDLISFDRSFECYLTWCCLKRPVCGLELRPKMIAFYFEWWGDNLWRCSWF